MLPSKVEAAVDVFNEALLAVASPDQARPDGSEGAAPLSPEEALAGAYERAINCIRHHLAVDSLTTGMLAEMGIGSESTSFRRSRPRLSPLPPVGRGPTVQG